GIVWIWGIIIFANSSALATFAFVLVLRIFFIIFPNKLRSPLITVPCINSGGNVVGSMLGQICIVNDRSFGQVASIWVDNGAFRNFVIKRDAWDNKPLHCCLQIQSTFGKCSSNPDLCQGGVLKKQVNTKCCSNMIYGCFFHC